MNKKKLIIIGSLFILIILMTLFLLSGRTRTDVYLKDFEVVDNKMILNVGVSSSAGYVRKMKRTSGSMNYYYTFYSTYGINSKLGAKYQFIIELDKNVSEIYFYTGDGGYKKVLEKDLEGNWIKSKM